MPGRRQPSSTKNDQKEPSDHHESESEDEFLFDEDEEEEEEQPGEEEFSNTKIKTKVKDPPRRCWSRNKCEDDNTLGNVTKRFMLLFQQANDNIVDINVAAKCLNIPKRRLYDITNVQEGIGFIEKVQKNKVRWVGGTVDPNLTSQISQIDRKILEANRDHMQLQNRIETLKNLLITETSVDPHLNYLTLADIEDIMKKQSIPHMLVIQGKVKGNLYAYFDPGSGATEVLVTSPYDWNGKVYSLINNNVMKQSQRDAAAPSTPQKQNFFRAPRSVKEKPREKFKEKSEPKSWSLTPDVQDIDKEDSFQKRKQSKSLPKQVTRSSQLPKPLKYSQKSELFQARRGSKSSQTSQPRQQYIIKIPIEKAEQPAEPTPRTGQDKEKKKVDMIQMYFDQ